MNRNRMSTILVGVLYIIGTVTGVLSVALTNPILENLDFLSRISANPSQLVIGVLMLLAMGLALAMVPVVMFGVFDHFSSMDALLRVPLGIQEMVLAVWLIVRGFNQPAFDPHSV